MRQILTILIALALVLPLGAREALGQADKAAAVKAEEHSRLGVEHYQAGRFPDAIREMLAAYQLVPDPGLLYNIARIYQKMGERQLALDFFSRFVKAEDADPGQVQKALGHIQEVRDQVQKDEQAALDLQREERLEREEEERRRREEERLMQGPDRTLAYTVGGLGAVALVAGGVLGGLAISASADVSNENIVYADRLQARDRGETLALLGDLAVGIGLAGLGAGAALYLLTDAPPEILSASPLIGPDHVGLGVSLRFE